MSHVMLTEYQLANFHKLMKAGRGFPLADLGPQGAFDSMPKGLSRRAKDAEPDGNARRAVAVVMRALEAKLGDDDFAELCSKLAGEPDEPEEAEDDEPTSGDPASQFETPMAREMNQKAQDKKRAKDRKAKDAPPDFEGCPKTHAEDSASDPRFDFVADAMRVKPSQPGSAYCDRSSQSARSGAVSASFDAMYPAAAKVQVR